MNIVEDRQGGNTAGYRMRSKTQFPHNEGRRLCSRVDEVFGGVRLPLPYEGHD